MSDDSNPSAEPSEDGPAGTNCALCERDISPNQYRTSRAVLIDESGPGEDRETVKMVCEECWAELDGELSMPTG